MELTNNTLLELGVDWLTVTGRPDSYAGLLEQKGMRLLNDEVKSGAEPRVWSTSGYMGYRAGHCEVGTRHDGTMVRLGGPLARSDWKTIYESADNCTRIDLQATIRCVAGSGPTIKKEYRRAKRVNKEKSNAAEVERYESTTGAATIYLGRRSSEVFGRIYDKGAESGLVDYLGCVRWEVEYKADRASNVAAYVFGSMTEAPAICQCLRTFFSDRLRQSEILSALQGSPNSTLEWNHSRRIATGNLQKLQWLRDSVGPSVRMLIRSGLWSEVQDAFGIMVQCDGEPIILDGPTTTKEQ